MKNGMTDALMLTIAFEAFFNMRSNLNLTREQWLVRNNTFSALESMGIATLVPYPYVRVTSVKTYKINK